MKQLLISLLLGTAILFGLGYVMFPDQPPSLSQSFGMMLFGLAMTVDGGYKPPPKDEKPRELTE